MNKMIANVSILTATVLLLTGCAGMGGTAVTQYGDTAVNNNPPRAVEATPEAAKPVTSARSQSVNTSLTKKVKTIDVSVMSNQNDTLRVKIQEEGSDSDTKAFASEIAHGIIGSLTMDTVKVITGENADLFVTVRPKLEQIDVAGEYYRMSASVSVDIKDASKNRIFGDKKITLKGNRALGKEKAVSNLVEPASKQIAEWCREIVKKVTEQEIDVDILKIQLPTWIEDGVRRTGLDNKNNERIAAILGNMKGIVSYGFVGYHSEEGTVEYRIVYMKENFKSGIASAVGIALKADTELK